MAEPATSWLTLLRHSAAKQELRWFGLLVLGVGIAVVVGADAALAVGLGLALYALWHLAQAVRLLALLLRDQDPPARRVWGIWGAAFDAVCWSKRRERKRKRRQQRFFARFRKIAAAMPDGVIILGSGGEVSWFNRQAEVYFDLGGRLALGRDLIDLVDHPLLRDYLQAGDLGRVFEIEAPGDPAVVLSISMTRFTKGRLRYLLVARDITRLHHLNHSQRDFTLNVSHELRTPLTVMQGYLETLLDTEDQQSPRRRPLVRMMEQTGRMQDVIQGLSTLARLEDGSEPIQRKPVAVLDMLADIVREGEDLARDTDHVLKLTGDPGLLLLGDESLLRSAFSNLVFNAIRHTPIRTRIAISWGRVDDHAELQVRDNGAGIPARHRARLAERFYRVDAGRSRDAGGTGLGLAIVRQILDIHDAGLLISSEEGHGFCFTCRFGQQHLQQIPQAPDEAAAS